TFLVMLAGQIDALTHAAMRLGSCVARGGSKVKAAVQFIRISYRLWELESLWAEAGFSVEGGAASGPRQEALRVREAALGFGAGVVAADQDGRVTLAEDLLAEAETIVVPLLREAADRLAALESGIDRESCSGCHEGGEVSPSPRTELDESKVRLR